MKRELKKLACQHFNVYKRSELNSNNAIFDLSNANAFNFIVNKVGQLSGNHIISAKKSSKVLKRKQYNELRKFKSDGIVYNPYVLPNDTAEIDFGIWWPTDRETVVLNYVTGDNFDVKEIKLTGNNKVLSDVTSQKLMRIW